MGPGLQTLRAGVLSEFRLLIFIQLTTLWAGRQRVQHSTASCLPQWRPACPPCLRCSYRAPDLYSCKKGVSECQQHRSCWFLCIFLCVEGQEPSPHEEMQRNPQLLCC